MLLELHSVSRHFDAVHAIDDLSLCVDSGCRHAITGANGAGKSTLLQLITGHLRPTFGRIRFDGKDITALPPHRRARLGIRGTFQHTSLLDGHTVADNVLATVLAAAGMAWRPWPLTRRHRWLDEQVHAQLHSHGLSGVAHTRAGELTHGQRRRLELLLALAAHTRLLVLDEPTAGLGTADTDQILAGLSGLPDHITIVFCDHNPDVIAGLATAVTALDQQPTEVPR
jgi:branched-chain amino acid transport system ATP-binding protein